MRRRHSLRFRVAAAFAGFGALVSILLAAGLYLAAHDVSQRLLDQTLRAEMDDYVARRARNPRSLPPDTATLRGFVAEAGGNAAGMPAAVLALAAGQHEIDLDGVPFRALVADRDGRRFVILFNQERQRVREQRFLAYLVAGALLMTLLSAAGGSWLAARVIAPVTELANKVGGAKPERPPRLVVEEEPEDELGELTRAFDRYLARLSAFVERERAFAADASHELRTPLAVIRGAAEVLADDPALGDAQRERIGRIERAAAEMADLIGALLLLAREDAAPAEDPCEAVLLVRECVDRQRPLAARRHTLLSLAEEATPRLQAHPALFAIVVANLVRNATAHTENGSVEVRLAADRLVVSDTGIGIRSDDIGRVFQRYYRGAESRGAGIGLSLVKRICDRQGWQILLESREGEGTTATLRFA
ncbi:MAG TPA: HAMP domain-containing sensor histidine kinase [Rhodocyclaceae bacterium]|nr:HAMP domain-containing sensor histidine kinase [Rhodocyclaceae bacterium]